MTADLLDRADLDIALGQGPEHAQEVGDLGRVAGLPFGQQSLEFGGRARDRTEVEQLAKRQAFAPAEQLGEQGGIEGQCGGPTFGQFTASFDTRPQQAVQALEVALDVLTKTGSADSLTKAELATATDMALNTFAFRFDSASRIAWERALSEFFGYDDDYLDRYRDRIAQVTAAQLNAATAKLTRQDALQIVIVGPKDVLGDLSRFGPVTVIEDVDAFR